MDWIYEQEEVYQEGGCFEKEKSKMFIPLSATEYLIYISSVK